MQEISKLVDYNKLTGAYSRTFGEYYLSHILAKTNVGLFYADIDKFKEVNDKFGHQAGDFALKQMVELVRLVMDMPNAVIRMGGDEFLFVFPDADQHSETRLREQLMSLLDGKLLLQDDS